MDSGGYSPWANTQATREVACPKCGAGSGTDCVTPSGRAAREPHWQRTKAYLDVIGREEWDRRHTRMPTKGLTDG
jgi:hypothetical protein